ncbi:MAG: cobalamin-binding protein [Chloroflexi bacterium]|nr:MAG: cobalamin-binding protein [Chloroflexota bacterium]
MKEELVAALVKLERDEVLGMVTQRIEAGEDPLGILEDCRQGMTAVGDLLQQGDYFLAELLLSAEIFKGAVAILQPHLAKSHSSQLRAKVVLATLKGDIHDLGKNILATLLQAQGFEVHDLGVDVPPPLVLEKVKEIRPEFVGFSALITTAFASMKEAADLLQQAGLRNGLKLMIGGGVTTPIVKDYVGADFQTLDAMEGVNYCLNVVGGR